MTKPPTGALGGVPSQVDKFRDLARELECDDDEARFDEKIKRLAAAPTAKASVPGGTAKKK